MVTVTVMHNTLKFDNAAHKMNDVVYHAVPNMAGNRVKTSIDSFHTSPAGFIHTEVWQQYLGITVSQ